MNVLKAGYGKVKITPPLGLELCGFGYYLERKANAVRGCGEVDETYVAALPALLIEAAAAAHADARQVTCSTAFDVEIDPIGFKWDLNRDRHNRTGYFAQGMGIFKIQHIHRVKVV